MSPGDRRRRSLGRTGARGRWQTQRVQHVPPGDARLHRMARRVRSAGDPHQHAGASSWSQNELCHIFGLDSDDVQVLTKRLGGGFGGGREMLTEDLGRPGGAAPRRTGALTSSTAATSSPWRRAGTRSASM